MKNNVKKNTREVLGIDTMVFFVECLELFAFLGVLMWALVTYG